MKPATRNDWKDLKPMAREPAILELNLPFGARQLRNLRMGFIPADQNEKWFLYFEADTLHIYRSWTGFKVFEVVFGPEREGACALYARVGLDREFYSASLEEAGEALRELLSDYASDEAHAPQENSFSSAILQAAQPNYLGAPSVVLELVTPLFWKATCNALKPFIEGIEPATFHDVLDANQRITAVLAGQEPGYHGLEGWRTEQALGKAVIHHFGLDTDWYADENLTCIVSEGLAGVSLQIRTIISDCMAEPPDNLRALTTLLGAFRQFVASVLLGTHTVFFPGITLPDFTWANRARFVRPDTAAETDGVSGETAQENSVIPEPEPRPSPSFQELLRQLEAQDEEHDPEDDGSEEEHWEDREDEEVECEEMREENEIPQPGPPLHPRLNDHGAPVRLTCPSTPTPQWTWRDTGSIATVIPDGPMPAALGGIAFETLKNIPRDGQGWETLAQRSPVSEPAFSPPPGKKAAAGVVIIEEDGRVWSVAPSNGFGGYSITFPKGTRDTGISLQATALREACEEAGLGVTLTGFLTDVSRSTSHTRYYLARRNGGNPADMGWESQAVILAPASELASLLTHANDKPILAALAKHLASGRK